MTLREQPDRPMCERCGVLAARPNGTSVGGYQRWGKYCNTCSKGKTRKKDDVCHECGFEASDQCQMCLVDGMTVCQNCNALRLKKRKKELTVDAEVDWSKVRL